MRLQLILPCTELTVTTLLSACLFYGDCQGIRFDHHQEVSKLLRDAVYEEVSAPRYQGLRYGRPVRAHPQGDPCSTSQRLQGLALL